MAKSGCAAVSVFGLSGCSGILQVIRTVETQKRSRIMQFAKDLLTQDDELCESHKNLLGKGSKTDCVNPALLPRHRKRQGRVISGRVYLEVTRANPGIIQINEPLCKDCLQLARTSRQVVSEDIDVGSDISDLDSEYGDKGVKGPDVNQQFSQDKLATLNNVLTLLGLNEITFTGNTNCRTKQVRESAADVKLAILDLFELQVESQPKSEFSNLVSSLQDKLKDASRTDRIKVAALFSSCLTMPQISEVFEISERGARIAKHLHDTAPVLADPPAKKRKGLDDDIKEKVVTFFESDEVSRASPNTKDVITVCDDDGNEKLISRRLLLTSVEEAHAMFLDKNQPEELDKPIISLSTFRELRPNHCLLLKDAHKFSGTCLCIYHENVRLLYQAIGIREYEDFISKLVCDIKRKTCMFRKCTDCNTGVHREAFISHTRDYIKTNKSKFEEMDIPFEEWSQSTRELKIRSSLGLEDFLIYLADKSESFLRHHRTSICQAIAFKRMKENVDDITAVIQVDFSENYVPVYPDEVQKVFFTKDQSTIHPFVITLREDSKVKHVPVVVISDELHHATNTYYVFQKRVIEWLKEKHPKIEHIVYWSDGAASQYKNFKNMANLRNHQEDFDRTACHHFFASCHGKGSCDAIGGVVKCKARRESYAGQIIQTPQQLFDCVSKKLNFECLFVSAKDVQDTIFEKNLEMRYQNSSKVAHIREMHKVEARSDGLYLFELSEDEDNVGVMKNIEKDNWASIEVNDWIAAVYDGKWYFGQVKRVLAESEEFNVRFFSNPGESSSTFSKFEASVTCVPWCNVVATVPAPSKPTSRAYQWDDDVKQAVILKFNEMK